MTGAPEAARSGTTETEPVAELTARWSALSLSLDDRTLTAVARQLAAEIPELDDLTVHASPGELSVTIVVKRFGVPLSARASLSQIRFKDVKR